uniref:Uncharacterized protein n=1 Tax=Anguilla anguilla TaxID=7936 RepID=A0A0E9R7F5_ANGAN
MYMHTLTHTHAYTWSHVYVHSYTCVYIRTHTNARSSVHINAPTHKHAFISPSCRRALPCPRPPSENTSAVCTDGNRHEQQSGVFVVSPWSLAR